MCVCVCKDMCVGFCGFRHVCGGFGYPVRLPSIKGSPKKCTDLEKGSLIIGGNIFIAVDGHHMAVLLLDVALVLGRLVLVILLSVQAAVLRGQSGSALFAQCVQDTTIFPWREVMPT
jgi:hypothetical protein